MSDAMRAFDDNPFLTFIGARMVEWTREHALIALPIRPEHLNRSGVVHGGVYTILVDAAGGMAGCYSEPGTEPVRAFTLSMTTSFLDAASGGTLHARGTLKRRGLRVYFASVEVSTDDGRLAAIGEGTFLYHTRGAKALASERKDT